MRQPPVYRMRPQAVVPRLNHPDVALLVSTAALVCLGIVCVFNASYFFAQDRFGAPLLFFWKHLVAVGLGSLVLVAVSQLRLEVIERGAYVLLLLSAVLLVAVLIPGVGVLRGGARRWLSLGVMMVQPSELAKFAVIAYLARSITRKQDRMQTWRFGILPHLLLVALCTALIASQPDFGTAAIIWLVLLLMLFVGGGRPLHVGTLTAAVAGGVVVAIWAEPYRAARFLAFLDPWKHSKDTAFQLVQSLIAFGSGGVIGNGLGASKQKMFFLPEAHNDFIFAVVGEELGLAGALLVLALFAVVGYRGFRIALRHPDCFGSLLAFGITVSLLLCALVNVGVVLGLLPTKGLPLPFVSYGGSAMLGALAQVGVLAALSRMTG